MRPTTHRSVGLLAALALTFGMIMPVGANEVTELAPVQAPPVAEDLAINELANTWFVELNSPPAAKGTPPGQLKREKDNFRGQARNKGLEYTERFAYSSLFNGLSITIGEGQLGTLREVPGVKAIWPVVTLDLDPIQQIDPELATALAMTGADAAQSELGLTGEGITVAVMDTGIDYDHPDLGGGFGPGFRVEAGHDFVGDEFNADPSSTAYNPTPAPDNDPDDCNGHGTHVAGIVGASAADEDGVTGVAPGVTLGAYRVFGCEGSTTTDIMAAAMERAYADGMDVLNMSIGSSFQWPQYPTAVAADTLVDRGMVVVASIGNSGANGTYSTGAPGNGAKVIGVASFDNSHIEQTIFVVNPDGSEIGYAPAAAAPAPPTSGDIPLVRPPAADDFGCQPFPAGSLDGDAVLIQRGGPPSGEACAFHIKALNAQNAGADAVVLYNNVAGPFSPTVAGDPAITIPVVAITRADGLELVQLITTNGGEITLTWTDETRTSVNPTGGLISSFSSYGLSPDLSFKPNIGAPGGLIRSTYPLEEGGYATISGTSMSSPHVAGAVALYLEAHPGTAAADIKTRLQNAADPKNWWGNPGLGFLDNTFRQGAGMLDIDDAIVSTAAVSPSEIAMGESQSGAQTHTLTISNTASAAVTYSLSHVGALSTGPSASDPTGKFVPGFYGPGSAAVFSPASVEVPAGATVTVDATITPAAGPTPGNYGGYLVLTGSDETVMRVPYAGFIGDYQSIQALTPTALDLPDLARLTDCEILRGLDCTFGGSYEVRPEDDTFTLDTSGALPDVPYILVHLDHQVQALEMVVLKASNGKPVHPVFNKMLEMEYVGRNSTASSFFAFAWDGTRSHSAGNKGKTKDVPDGTYVIEIRALKALGDASNPAHWEVHQTVEINIDRP